jgi:hypothetical protein
VYVFSANVIIPILPQTSVIPSEEIALLSSVIALYPNSSCFYSAKVVANPNMHDGENYVVVFDDDNSMERDVAQGMVLEVPSHLAELVD